MSGLYRPFLPAANAAARANETFKQRIAKARAALGAQRSDTIIAELKNTLPDKWGSAAARANAPRNLLLKETCTALEAALPSVAKTARRESSVMELAPKPTDNFPSHYAAELIRFYVSECRTTDDRAAFAAKFGHDVGFAFSDLAIVAAIRAGEPATKLDVRIFEARAATVTPSRRVHIRWRKNG